VFATQDISPELEPDLPLEIAHLLLIDVVGYSKLLVNEQIAFPLTPALLRLDPMFDPLRNDPRFQKLVASPTPKER
jgi:hypothetical protein